MIPQQRFALVCGTLLVWLFSHNPIHPCSGAACEQSPTTNVVGSVWCAYAGPCDSAEEVAVAVCPAGSYLVRMTLSSYLFSSVSVRHYHSVSGTCSDGTLIASAPEGVGSTASLQYVNWEDGSRVGVTNTDSSEWINNIATLTISSSSNIAQQCVCEQGLAISGWRATFAPVEGVAAMRAFRWYCQPRDLQPLLETSSSTAASSAELTCPQVGATNCGSRSDCQCCIWNSNSTNLDCVPTGQCLGPNWQNAACPVIDDSNSGSSSSITAIVVGLIVMVIGLVLAVLCLRACWKRINGSSPSVPAQANYQPSNIPMQIYPPPPAQQFIPQPVIHIQQMNNNIYQQPMYQPQPPPMHQPQQPMYQQHRPQQPRLPPICSPSPVAPPVQLHLPQASPMVPSLTVSVQSINPQLKQLKVPSASTLSDIVVDFSELKLDKLLGAGSFGKVYSGRFRETPVAIKTLIAEKMGKEELAAFISECTRLKATHHPNCLLLMCITLTPPTIVTELADRSLEDALHGTGNKRITLSTPQQWNIALGTARGVAALHLAKIPVVHRDLKSPNILLDEHLNPMVSDFGLACVKPKGQMLETMCGSPLWMAPEILTGKNYDQRADIYSLGIVFYEICTGTLPFVNEKDFHRMIAATGRRPKFPRGISSKWHTLIEGCWAQQPEARWTISKVVKYVENECEALKQKHI